jgi:hypothetical protein
MPLTEICNNAYSDSRERQLFKNIIYVGALTTLLDIDPAEIEKLFSEQYKGKEKLFDSNVQALNLGRDYARAAPQADRAQGRAPRFASATHLRRRQQRRRARLHLWRRDGLRLVSDHPVVVGRRSLSALRAEAARRPGHRRAALRRSSRPKTNWRRSAWSSAPAGTARAPSPPPPAPASR